MTPDLEARVVVAWVLANVTVWSLRGRKAGPRLADPRIGVR
jgi:hypothetical protein